MDWSQYWVAMKSSNYWEDSENIRKFLEQIARVIGVKKPSDWGNLTQARFEELGGSALLHRHKLSLKNILKIGYPGESSINL